MADYIVQGKKGSGKSLIMVSRMLACFRKRAPVATNLDLYLEKMLPPMTRDVLCYRLPDRPSIDDLHLIGFGSLQVDEATYGTLALDECAAMLNARTFNDKGRSALLDWFVHSRKLGWDTHFICQNMVQIDKQVRESLAEFVVSCKRMDRIRIPFVGVLTKHLLGFELRPPKVHMATIRYGMDRDAMVSDRWTYRGVDLYAAYNTRQVFRPDYEHGTYCLLTPWHLVGRHGAGRTGLVERVKAFFGGGAVRAAVKREQAPLVKLLAKLPPDQRISHWRRLNALGAV